mgnify:CR=1 FL=1
MNDFKFLGVRSASGLSVIQSDGVCGIGPRDEGGNTNPINAMFHNLNFIGKITVNAITFHLTSDSSTSWIDVGEPESGMDGYAWAKMPENSAKWGLSMYDNSVSGLVAVGAILDSGSSYINIPNADLSALKTFVVTKKTDCFVSDQMIKCPCTGSTNLDNDFPELKFTVGNQDGSAIITMKGSNYMLYVAASSQC